MPGFQTLISTDQGEFKTLRDIIPDQPGLKILFIAKTPAPVSVEAGHYFQGRQGRMFWNKLKEYRIIKVPCGAFEDDYLLDHLYGITDIVKKPRAFGNEPSDQEYREGLQHISDLIEGHKPTVLVFVYKKVLDQILKFSFNFKEKSVYGFNDNLEHIFKSKVFVFPMPGTPCPRLLAHEEMQKLSVLINSAND